MPSLSVLLYVWATVDEDGNVEEISHLNKLFSTEAVPSVCYLPCTLYTINIEYDFITFLLHLTNWQKINTVQEHLTQDWLQQQKKVCRG